MRRLTSFGVLFKKRWKLAGFDLQAIMRHDAQKRFTVVRALLNPGTLDADATVADSVLVDLSATSVINLVVQCLEGAQSKRRKRFTTTFLGS
jgi:hypothetical protein